MTQHTFHIPVMGTGFTIDTPAKVAHLGISSVISLVDDVLIERMRELYCRKLDIPFQAISKDLEDFRARRITEYLNLMDRVVNKNFENLIESIHHSVDEVERYLRLLPSNSELKSEFRRIQKEGWDLKEIQQWALKNFSRGSIDVNIMTKLDKENRKKGKALPAEYNDAHAALRGFALSNLHSSLVLSAGLNPRLFAYMETLEGFYPDDKGEIQKEITLKVSDYRSALIQGKVLAKKGLWVSEYRLESGLNCGGHAFATDGHLLGPILEAFKQDRHSLIAITYQLWAKSLKKKGKFCPDSPPSVRFTAQGGIGTAEEHQFLLDHFELDSIGWGSPFLLVPEATNVDHSTHQLLQDATEEDLFLSHTSPLGIPFNTLRGNTKDLEKLDRIKDGKPGSPCTKKFASLNKEFTEEVICLSSRKYQSYKLNELEAQNLPTVEFEIERQKIIEKSCICVGLGTTALLANELDTGVEGDGVSICPGPNMAYFSDVVSLEEMVDHIYGRTNITPKDRPDLFVKELGMYVDYYKDLIDEATKPILERQERQLKTFKQNLEEGIAYYRNQLTAAGFPFSVDKLKGLEDKLNSISLGIAEPFQLIAAV